MRPQEHTSGAKAHVHFALFSARLKSCPFKAEGRVKIKAEGCMQVKAEGCTRFKVEDWVLEAQA